MKKATAIFILLVLTLHCGSRLGLLTAMFNQRYKIAVLIGLMEEKPIVECNSEYFTDDLVITNLNDSASSLPASIFHAQEIQLFFETHEFSFNPLMPVRLSWAPSNYTVWYPEPSHSIFHPPSVG